MLSGSVHRQDNDTISEKNMLLYNFLCATSVRGRQKYFQGKISTYQLLTIRSFGTGAGHVCLMFGYILPPIRLFHRWNSFTENQTQLPSTSIRKHSFFNHGWTLCTWLQSHFSLYLYFTDRTDYNEVINAAYTDCWLFKSCGWSMYKALVLCHIRMHEWFFSIQLV